MKCEDCEYCGENKGVKCESCINYSNFREGFKVKNIDEKIEQAEKLVQAKRVQGSGDEITKRIKEMCFEPRKAILLDIKEYENLSSKRNKEFNQELEIKNLKSAIEDMNSKLLKKNKEINELQAVIKTLGGLL